MSDWNILMLGAGVMGRGIAEVFASRGIKITLYDAFPEQLAKAKEQIPADMKAFAEQGLADEKQIANVEKFVFFEEKLENIAPKVNLVIEGVFENVEVKRDAYKLLSDLCAPDCILCSNTSSFNIFEIAKVQNPERLLIAHFFNPPYVMPLVEVVADGKTAPEVVAKVKALLLEVGKEPAVINNYIPGFIVNRLDNVLCREIGYMISQGWTTPEDVETAIKYTSGTRYAFEGPLTLHDVVGWDLTTTVTGQTYDTLCNDTGEDKYGRALIEQGRLGLKTGKGCYDYDGVDVQEYMKKRSRRIVKMLHAIRTLDD